MEDVFSRLSHTESLEGEKAVTTIGLCHRATVFFADEFLVPTPPVAISSWPHASTLASATS